MKNAQGKRIDRAEAIEAIDLHIGARIRVARESMRGMSRAQLAPLIGYSAKQIGKWEAGENRVFSQALYALSRALALPVGFFFEGMMLDAAQEHAAAAMGVTAQDMSALITPETVQIVQRYAALTPTKKRLVRQMLAELSADEGSNDAGGEARNEAA